MSRRGFRYTPGPTALQPGTNVPPQKKRAYGGHCAMPGMAMTSPASTALGFAAAVVVVNTV
jgi:hypothetical protein